MTHPIQPTVAAPHSDVSVENARRETRLLKWGILLALVLAAAWPLTLNLVDPDLWGHIRYGQDWLALGELPRTATHTFTADGYPWINHENLAELALALGYEWLGASGLLLAKCAVGLAMVLSMVAIVRRQGVHPWVAWAWMLVVTTNLQPFFILRPQLLSFLLCAAMLVVLDLAFRDWHEQRKFSGRPLWLLPAVIAVWTNSHGGFLAGLAILGAYLGGRILELLVERKDHYRSKVVQLTAIGVASLAATLINPYGWQLHEWMIASLIQPRPEITEWLAPHPSDPVFWPWLGMLALVATSLVATKHRRDWVQIAILLLVIWQSALHLRHVAFVALVSGFWVPVHFQSALQRLLPTCRASVPPAEFSGWLRRVAVVALLLAISFQSFALQQRLATLPVDRGRFPVDALQYMADRQFEGKLVVTFNWAQYALAALAPQIEVAFDGRYDTCYPVEVVDMHFDFLLGECKGKRQRSPLSGPIDGTRVLSHLSPDLVLLDRLYENPVAIMNTQRTRKDSEWVLLYRDRVADIWGCRTKFDDPASPDFVPMSLRVFDPSPREGEIAWPAFPLSSNDSQLADEAHTHPTPAAQF